MDAREKSYLMAVFLALAGGSCGGYALGSRDAGGQASRAYEAGRKAGFVQGQDEARIRPIRLRRIHAGEEVGERAKLPSSPTAAGR